MASSSPRSHCRSADSRSARRQFCGTAAISLASAIARAQAIALARDIAAFPQTCLRADRLSALRQWDLEEQDAIANEMRGGLAVIASGETLSGAARFASGVGRHGTFGGESSRG